MTTYILDTNILLGYLRGAGFAAFVEKKYAPFRQPNIVVISDVSVGEIYSLAIQFNWGEEKKEKLKDLLNKLPTVGISHQSIISKYAEIHAYNIKNGKALGNNDTWIAATGSVLNGTLLTTDKDFIHLDGKFLKVELIDQSLKGDDAIVQ